MTMETKTMRIIIGRVNFGDQAVVRHGEEASLKAMMMSLS